ncbi:hypothetical protein SERLA73DRAFT_68008 [Serpula lacrymans var. lacrymans S7.3]|uniref:Uncharacterized protein n=2 Tax=Serpula lacrymans var. lacrymans TaxID=341189 RepID=F8PG62_SERL3|nr:uncharacterized protein SERLADRAFT_431712 [Serpula lacrymans var. lacrymans S7.9]EGO04309.1 hypothetical protein SERLA73DRAFT_68008 [Serpula lacrymans var. lacrymans S7.3]EGO30231.1 hypothetical protein SERLADRAFT_431712 [Serpula lacrymans var. lacrymans S7.9]
MPLTAHQQLAHNPKLTPPPQLPDIPELEVHDVDNNNSVICYTTKPNTMGLYHVYPTCPTLVPIDTLDDVCDAPTLHQASQPALPPVLSCVPRSAAETDDVFSAFTNPTCGLLMAWQHSGTTMKSGAELNRLLHFIQHPLFDQKDMDGFCYN